MGPLELFAILVLAGAIIVLLYYYIQETRGTGGTGFGGVKSSISDVGNRVSEGISQQYNNQNSEGEGKMSGVSERVSEMGERLRGKVKDVPISTDVLSGRIDEFLNEQSGQLIKDWELATKSDVNQLEKKYSKVARDIDDLEKRFSEYRGHANKKFESIEKRLTSLEGEEPEKSE
jgi:predicted RNase H-like nuclease (RuvC/YqgF family)